MMRTTITQMHVALSLTNTSAELRKQENFIAIYVPAKNILKCHIYKLIQVYMRHVNIYATYELSRMSIVTRSTNIHT